MELMLIVWAVSILSGLPALLSSLALVWVFATIILFLPFAEGDVSIAKPYFIKYLYYPKLAVLGLILFLVIPNEKTMKYMAGAYLLQTTYESDVVQEAIPLGKKAIINQLKQWASDNEELAALMEVPNEPRKEKN